MTFRINPRVAAFDRAIELADRTRLGMPDAVTNLMDSRAGHPRAQSYDRSGASGPIPFCWTHEQAVTFCERQGDLCRGETILHVDPTGDAAMQGDPAAVDIRRLDKALQDLMRAANVVADVVAKYGGRSATSIERRGVDSANEAGCQSCARVDSSKGVARWEPILHEHTDVKGNLEHAYALCAWCYRWTLDTGRLPHLGELNAHHDGSRVLRPA